jgi:beta-phosphoglucomutase-like phosphatase (HAD superfamily)
MIASLFFEVEGVLAATAPLRRTALARALSQEGIAPARATETSLDASIGIHEAVRRAVSDLPAARDETALTLIALRADRELASLVQSGVSLAPGARELVEQAVTRCRLAIVTGLDRSTVTSILALADLESAFEVIVAREDVVAGKPHPDAHRKAIERLGRRRPLDLRTALALESGAAGARAARDAGLRCAIVAPFHAENVVDADAMLSSLVGETTSSLDALLSTEAA